MNRMGMCLLFPGMIYDGSSSSENEIIKILKEKAEKSIIQNIVYDTMELKNVTMIAGLFKPMFSSDDYFKNDLKLYNKKNIVAVPFSVN